MLELEIHLTVCCKYFLCRINPNLFVVVKIFLQTKVVQLEI